MAQFDPAAATAAYLATLSPAGHAKATAYTQGGHWLLLWGSLVTLAACWLILRSGLLARIKAGLERRRPRPWLTAFVLALVFLVADFLLELPWGIYAGWQREIQYGMTSRPLAGFLADGAISFGVALPVLALFYAALYWLVRRAPRSWPLWAGVITGGFVLFSILAQPVVIEPLLNHYTPAPPGPVRTLVVDMGRQNGVPTDKIFVYNGSKQSNRYTANVAGLGPTARVALSDTMFRQGADISEIRGVVGHEMGHYVLHHVLWGALFAAVMAAIGSGLVMLLFPLAARLMGAAGARLADPAMMPVAYALVAVLSFTATPVFNTWTRSQEAAADAFSFEHAHDPDGLAKALVKTIPYRASSPGDLEEFLFYDHPSVEHRVRAAMDWKAAHPEETPEQ
jgi:STE24 endopeptidase